MLNKILEDIAEQLRQSGQYRIINKYYKPEGYNTDSSTDKKLIGVFLDTETTGLSCVTDRIIELGMVKFEYRPISMIAAKKSYKELYEQSST